MAAKRDIRPTPPDQRRTNTPAPPTGQNLLNDDPQTCDPDAGDDTKHDLDRTFGRDE